MPKSKEISKPALFTNPNTVSHLLDFLTSFNIFRDINKGYEGVINYQRIDKFTIAILWWQFTVFAVLAVLNSFFKFAQFSPSPFSWRIIPVSHALICIAIVFAAALLPTILRKYIKNHYIWRVLIAIIFTLFSYLFIFISGGAIEMHFYFFIVMTYLSVYADWRLPWLIFVLTLTFHTVLSYSHPDWIYHYGSNEFATLEHGILLCINAIFTSYLCNVHRTALIFQKESERKRDEFISVASHELKTPLTSIKAYAQLLNRYYQENQDTKPMTYLKRMESQIDRLKKLVEDLLDISKIQLGKLELNEEIFNFDELVTGTIQDLQQITKHHKLIKSGAANIHVFGDKNRINQVLTNLITNAVKYSPNATKVLIKTKFDNHQVTVAIEDFGIGIPKDKQTKIFDRFYRVDSEEKAIYPGLGLGLYISAEIMRRHHGKMWVNSIQGKGSAFYFTLPITLHSRFIHKL